MAFSVDSIITCAAPAVPEHRPAPQAVIFSVERVIFSTGNGAHSLERGARAVEWTILSKE
ncbi:MAG: hypothetical protein V4671_00295 [Armatimonadota bacterium]